MGNPLDSLKKCSDIGSLRLGLGSLCSRFGSITRLDILTARQAGKRQALCFLRMGSPEQEQQVMSELGVGRFGGDLVVVIDLQNSGALML
ncbi:MAG TPA: RNA-binding protein [Polaromonas sp.]|nr:RNA-binding protein [Polaromonas sp.]